MIFQNDPYFDDIQQIIAGDEIIIIKSCFPSSNVEAWGEAADTLYPDYKTVYNYKWHWRNIINKMKRLPHNFFAVWTNAPLVENDNTYTLLATINAFNGTSPVDTYTDQDPWVGTGTKKIFYKISVVNSCPLESERSDAAWVGWNGTFLKSGEFETGFTAYKLFDCFPNPFNPNTTIRYQIPRKGFIFLKIYNMLGCEVAALVNEEKDAGLYEVNIECSNLPSGIYYAFIKVNDFNAVNKLLLIK